MTSSNSKRGTIDFVIVVERNSNCPRTRIPSTCLSQKTIFGIPGEGGILGDRHVGVEGIGTRNGAGGHVAIDIVGWLEIGGVTTGGVVDPAILVQGVGTRAGAGGITEVGGGGCVILICLSQKTQKTCRSAKRSARKKKNSGTSTKNSGYPPSPAASSE